MSTVALPSSVPVPPPQARRRRALRIPILVKFTVLTTLLIMVVMLAVGYTLVVQQRLALGKEVLGRGRTTAENMAIASRDYINEGDIDYLTLTVLTARAVQSAEAGQLQTERYFDYSKQEEWIPGLKQAFHELMLEVPRALMSSLGQGFVASHRRAAIENEGIYEAVIVDKNGLIASHYKGAEMQGKKYEAPTVIALGGEGQTQPIYEFQDEKGRKRRLFHLEHPIVSQVDGGQKGTVHLGLDTDLVDRVISKASFKLAAVALAAVVIGFLGTILLVTWLTAPIGNLGKGVLAIAGGDFNTRVKVASRDELGELTHAFNTMAVSLSQNETLKGAFTRYVSGAALKQLLADPSKSGLHSRRTLATIFTSDVRGFTAMSETLPPEDVVKVINTYLGLQTEIIVKLGGVVDKFIGDATIGVWGKETPSPDDALQAVKAAWECQKAIAKLNAKRETKGEVVKLIGIGVNTGEVVSGNMGSSKKMEYTVTGEHVIFADQICAECPGGMVWISQSTLDLVKEDVIVEEQELKPKAGNKKGIAVYEVVGFR